MELRHLRTFVVLAEELHFGRAAARLHTVQSAVSHTLKALESEIGASLFDRSRRRVVLTAGGRGFLEQVRTIQAQLDQAVASTRRAAEGKTGRVTLRFTTLSALTMLPSAIVRFRREYPEVELSIAQQGSEQQLNDLRRGLCDLCFVSRMKAERPLESETVTSEPLVALLPGSHPLARRRTLRVAELAKDAFIMPSRVAEPDVQARFLAGCRRAGFEPRRVLELDQSETIVAFVASGLGVSLAPAGVSGIRIKGVVSIPVTPRIEVGITAVWDPTRLEATGKNFLGVLRDERQRFHLPAR